MKKRLLTTITCLSAALSGCSNQPIRTFESPTIVNLAQLVQSGEYTQKTDVLYTVLDASSSMAEPYLGVDYPGDSTATKFSIEKVLLQRLNKSMADLPLNAVAIRNFGNAPCLTLSAADLVYGSSQYTKEAFANSLGKTECASGGSPIHKSLFAAGEDLKKTNGNIAVLILSDGYHFNSSPEAAIRSLKNQYGKRLCVYSVWVGNQKEAEGRAALTALSEQAGCGFATTAEAIASERHFDDFTKQLFLTQAEPAPAPAPVIPPAPVDGDEDQDGVPDSRDKCPKTPKGAKVNKEGCWVIEGVHFDFDKSVIKPEDYPKLDEVVEVIRQNPGLNIEIQGHTDSIGTPEYNLPLSVRRANAVKEYLSAKAAKQATFSAQGYGLTRPVEPNDTEEGRAHNRRSQLIVIEQ